MALVANINRETRGGIADPIAKSSIAIHYPRQKILLIDDDPLTQRLVKHSLEHAGYETIVASNRADSMAMLESEHPDLIIMDVIMPEVKGLEAVRRIKRTEHTHQIPVIIVTANTEYYEVGRLEAFGSGASAFLTKPISVTKLLRELDRLIGQRWLAA